MVLTKKDFEQQATTIAKIKDKGERETTTKHFVEIDRQSNPRFDEGRFRTWIDDHDDKSKFWLHKEPKWVLKKK